MQSVVLGRRHPMYDPEDEECDAPNGLGLGQLIRLLLRSILPLPYKKGGGSRNPEQSDAESIDPDRLQRMISTAKKMKMMGREKEDEDESAEIERLVDLDSEREKPRKLMRAREGRRRREGYWKRHRQDDEEDDRYTRRRSSRGEEDEVGRRWRNRRGHRRRSRSWEEVDEDRIKKATDEERRKKAYETEWETQKDGWNKKNQEGREFLYLPPPFHQTRNLLRPRTDDYIR